MRAFDEWRFSFRLKLLDLLFNLERVVHSLTIPTCSIKWLCLANSTIPYCIAAMGLTHFRSKCLLTLAFWRFLQDSNLQPFVPWTNAHPIELKNQFGCRCAVGLVSFPFGLQNAKHLRYAFLCIVLTLFVTELGNALDC